MLRCENCCYYAETEETPYEHCCFREWGHGDEEIAPCDDPAYDDSYDEDEYDYDEDYEPSAEDLKEWQMASCGLC